MSKNKKTEQKQDKQKMPPIPKEPSKPSLQIDRESYSGPAKSKEEFIKSLEERK